MKKVSLELKVDYKCTYLSFDRKHPILEPYATRLLQLTESTYKNTKNSRQ